MHTIEYNLVIKELNANTQLHQPPENHTQHDDQSQQCAVQFHFRNTLNEKRKKI